MELGKVDPEIAAMEAEHLRLQAELRRMKKGTLDALTKDLERATSPFKREYLQRELERVRKIGPELDVA
jgi:hypothetical protein